ncbi:MAG: NAD(P)/FAD-dependent oxidoreductase [Akkermansiaceae bacterium]
MRVDFLIIGQGLAGSTLAMELLKRGRSVLVVDRQDGTGSTRIAAGLVTPLTGKGMNPAWRQVYYLPKAVAFYHQLEKESGRKFYHSTPVVRVFASEKEHEKWQAKEAPQHPWAYELDHLDGPFRQNHGAIEMPEGAWLDTLAFLHVVQDKLMDAGAWREAVFTEADVSFVEGKVLWQDVTADKIILCQGAYGLSGVDGYQGWFSHIHHRSAKGEILNVWIDGLDETKRYHCRGWLAPREGGMWKAGANYDWKHMDATPSEEGKSEVLEKLRTWIKLGDSGEVPMEVIDHQAGIRPIIRNSMPVVGFHPKMPMVGFFNGLGSKGTLMAPAVAEHFAAHLCGESELDEELRLPN